MITQNKLDKAKQKELEEKFYKLQDEFLNNGSKKAWDEMFFIMEGCCASAMKKFLVGIKRDDVDELILEATIQVMNRYKKPKGYRVDKLLSVAHWAAFGVLRDPNLVFQDKLISLDQWQSYEMKKEKESR